MSRRGWLAANRKEDVEKVSSSRRSKIETDLQSPKKKCSGNQAIDKSNLWTWKVLGRRAGRVGIPRYVGQTAWALWLRCSVTCKPMITIATAT